MISEKGNKIRQTEAKRVYSFIFCFGSENIIFLVVPSTNDIAVFKNATNMGYTSHTIYLFKVENFLPKRFCLLS